MNEDPKHVVLYVDDEPHALTLMKRLLGEEYKLLTAESVDDGIKVLDQCCTEIQVLLCDQRMPGAQGVELLSYAKEAYPHIVRILITGFSDNTATVSTINRGEIFRYIEKPIRNINVFRADMHSAIEYYKIIRVNAKLASQVEQASKRIILVERIGQVVIALKSQTQFKRSSAAICALLMEIPKGSSLQKNKSKNEFWSSSLDVVAELIETMSFLQFASNNENPFSSVDDFVAYLREIYRGFDDKLKFSSPLNDLLPLDVINVLGLIVGALDVQDGKVPAIEVLAGNGELGGASIRIGSELCPVNIQGFDFSNQEVLPDSGAFCIVPFKLLAFLYLQCWDSGMRVSSLFEGGVLRFDFDFHSELDGDKTIHNWLEDLYVEYGMEY